MGGMHYAHGAVAVGMPGEQEGRPEHRAEVTSAPLFGVGPTAVSVALQTLGALLLSQVGLGSTGLGSSLAHGEWL